ncbi:geranylgeranyl transferase type-2 subunit alpha isoform X2 [Orussus abietinus]|nr:geranylgeranyl transferase type-2 subunit alpha isoform X2 [Orussus abietinus]
MCLKNPDIYTLWNIRRQAFNANNWSKDIYQERLLKELTLTENCLRENPKSYSAWHHRHWVIDHLPDINWKAELALCTKYLNMDDRNFHCWNYRQYLVTKAGVPDAEEFEFSTAKILNNFSNYSSWHYRSKILSKMFPDESGELPIQIEKHKEELDLVMNATFTDPNDSSAWFYQRWLLDYHNVSTCAFWRAQITNSEITAVFHKEVSIDPMTTFLKIQDNKIPLIWKSYGDKKFSKLWSATFSEPLSIFRNVDMIQFHFEGTSYSFRPSNQVQTWIAESTGLRIIKDNSQFKEQLDNYKQLSEMEPNNKWALLTRIFLMKNIDPIAYHQNILNDISALSKIDKLRSNYFNDLRSRYALDFVLHHLIRGTDIEVESKIDFSGLDLTMFYNEQYCSFLEEVNLNSNKLGNSLYRLQTLQNCRKLSLSNNDIKTLKSFPTLKKLEYLSLQNNDLLSVDEIIDVVKRHDLKILDIRDNPVNKSNNISRISNISPTLEIIKN